jgi:hypothetical protein
MSAMLFLFGAWSTLTRNGNNNAAYKVSWECVPKTCGGPKKNVDEFWLDHFDKTAYELNAIFREMGWLLRDASELSPNSKSAILTKEYKSELHEAMYSKVIRLLSGGRFKESASILHKPTDKHLF